METNKNTIKSLETKIKILEIENQKLASNIEANKKEIEEYKSIIKSLSSDNETSTLGDPLPTLTEKPENEIINIKFGWKINDNARVSNDLKAVKKVAGGRQWNCSAVGNKSLINGKINKWKIQIDEMKKTDSIVFGIIPKGINLNEIDNWKKGYVTCSDNFAKHNLGEWTEFAKRCAKEGNIIEIIANLEMGELSFSINGDNVGIFCNNIIKDIEYLPFLDIYGEGTKVRLLEII